MPPTTRSRRSLINEKLANGLDDSTITSVFRPAVPFSAGYGVFARLPLEVRREIWRHLLLIEYNTISREPKVVERNDTTGRKGEILDFPDRTYDTYPTILWTSKAIYLEASDVFYRENMLVRVTVQAFGLGDDFNLVDRLLNDTIKGAFTGAGDFIDFDRSLAACKLHAMDVEMTRVKGLEECGRVEKVQLMIPASQLYHVITLLHSLLVAGWRDDHFSDAHKLVLRVRNKYGMSEELAFQRLLAPFRGLYAMQRAKITGMKRTLVSNGCSPVFRIPIAGARIQTKICINGFARLPNSSSSRINNTRTKRLVSPHVTPGTKSSATSRWAVLSWCPICGRMNKSFCIAYYSGPS